MKAACYGSMVRDITYHVPHFVRPGETLPACDRQVFLGGKGLNQALALRRAGLASVHMAGAIGEDGDVFLRALEDCGIGTELVRRLAMPSGHAMIQITPEGQNAIVHFGGANRSIPADVVRDTVEFLEPGDWLLLQNEINLVPEMVAAAAQKGIRVVFNPSPCDESLQAVPLELVSYLVLNEIEGAALSGVSRENPAGIMKALREKYPATAVILTLGGDGAWFDDGREAFSQKAFPVTPVDTVGAGDTFTGFLFASLAGGRTPRESMELASRAAAISVTRPGAAPSIPELQEVLNYNF